MKLSGKTSLSFKLQSDKSQRKTMAESEEKQEAEEPVEAPAADEFKPEEPPKPADAPKPPEPPQPEVQKAASEVAAVTQQSPKRASIDARKEVPVDQETFTPPPASTKTMPRASSMLPGGRRFSGSDKNLASGRKSKFGGLSSRARMVLGSIVDIKTNAMDAYDKRTARFQNTFRLESEKPFNSEKVDKILREVMDDVLENLHYDPDKCASTAKQASMQIRAKVKHLDFDRYKLVCIVSIGEKNSQDVYATCRFLWDAEKDRYAFYSLENTHVYAIAYCFGLYFE